MLDFLGIGAQKAGTTWLMERLTQHPDVWGSPGGKEIHYFDVVHLKKNRKKFWLSKISRSCAKRAQELKNQGKVEAFTRVENLLHRIQDPAHAFTDNWYQDLFSGRPKGKRTGEITPLYCTLPDEGIRHVKRLLPNTPIIFLIRDPYDRAISSLRMMAASRGTPPVEILAKGLFKARGDYASNVPRWDQAFSGGQILYIPFGDVRERPAEVLRTVEDHIGLTHFDGYREIETRVGSSASHDHIISDEVRAMIREVLQGQNEFILDRFGKEFFERIK